MEAEKEVIIMYYCDAWKGRDSMRLKGIFTEFNTLYDAIKVAVNKGNIEISCGNDCPKCSSCVLENDLKTMNINEINNNFNYIYVESFPLNNVQ